MYFSISKSGYGPPKLSTPSLVSRQGLKPRLTKLCLETPSGCLLRMALKNHALWLKNNHGMHRLSVHALRSQFERLFFQSANEPCIILFR